jgi:predicted CXXCH cytochrome family protein
MSDIFNWVWANTNCTAASCHQNIKQFRKLHGPNKADGCTICHRSAEGSNSPLRLKLGLKHPPILSLPEGEINNTCLLCHDDKTGKSYASVHKATAEKTCVACHNPHGSNQKHLIKMTSTKELCLSCHKDFKTEQHGGHKKLFDEPKSCLQCHRSHFSNKEKLLIAQTNTLCFQCHNKEIQTENGDKLANIESLAKNLKFFGHKPFIEGKCQSCHQPHGNTEHRFLTSPYTSLNSQLCNDCHKEFPTTTQFRNGIKNLHQFHTQEIKNKITCQSCHEVHASDQSLLIRNFGAHQKWKIPLLFSKKENGGSCTTACHGEKIYQRDQAFRNKEGR